MNKELSTLADLILDHLSDTPLIDEDARDLIPALIEVIEVIARQERNPQELIDLATSTLLEVDVESE